MELGFGHLLEVLAEMHPDVDPKVVSARLKYFQRLPEPFPSKATIVGAGARAAYSADDLMGLVLAFEFLAVGLAPLQSALLVRHDWPRLSSSFAKAWAGREGRDPMIVMAQVEGLGSKRGLTGSIAIGDEIDLRNWAMAKGVEDRRLAVFDAVRVAGALDRAIGATQPFKVVLAFGRLIEAWRRTVVERSAVRRTGT